MWNVSVTRLDVVWTSGKQFKLEMGFWECLPQRC